MMVLLLFLVPVWVLVLMLVLMVVWMVGVV